MQWGGGKGEAGSAFELLAPGEVPGGRGSPVAPVGAGSSSAPDRPVPATETGGAPSRAASPPPPAPGTATDPTAGRMPTPADPVAPAEQEPHPPIDAPTTAMESETKTETTPDPDGPTPPAEVGAEAAGDVGAPKRRPSRRGKVALGAGTLAAVAVLVLATQPWHGAQATPSQTSHPAAPAPAPHRSSLADAAATTTQPPPTADPSAPGQLVPSGENRSDPFLLHTQGRYYLYTSGTTVIPFLNVPVASTTDFKTWSAPKDAMVHLPGWAAEPYTWGPDVHRFGSHYVLYFTGYLKAFDEQCIGAALSSKPDGPFIAQHRPFICQSSLSGSIDPRVFTDHSGVDYMLWKSDQNAHGRSTPTTMWSQRLGSDGLSLLGSPSALMSPDEPWQSTVIEAPDMIEVNGVYWLAYAANWFNQPAYGVGVAWCAGPSGPCADLTDQPLISSNAQGQGPGEPSFYQDSTGVWMLYTPTMSLPGDPPRPVYITRVGFTAKGAYLAAGAPPSTPSTVSASKVSGVP